MRVVLYSLPAAGFWLQMLTGQFALAFILAAFGGAVTGALVSGGPLLAEFGSRPLRRRLYDGQPQPLPGAVQIADLSSS